MNSVFRVSTICLLITLFVAREYCIYITSLDSKNYGNQVDLLCMIYICSNGDQHKMIELTNRLMIHFPSFFMDNSFFAYQQPVNDINLVEKLNIRLLLEFSRPVLWTMNVDCKRHIRPLIKHINDVYIENTSDVIHENLSRTICIHVRCSDVPFNRQPNYLIANCKWYRRALNLAMEKMEHNNIDAIRIVSCHKHRGTKGSIMIDDVDNEDMCSFILDEYKRFIESIVPQHINVSVSCGSVEQDLYNLTRCGCLIASTGSFAYYAGYASDNVFIVSESLGKGHKRQGMFELPNDLVYHSDVANYFDKSELKLHLACDQVTDIFNK